MDTQPKLLHKQRRFATAFKKAIVQDFETGRYSVLQLSRLHGISLTSIYNWIHQFSHHNERGTRIVEYADSTHEKLRQLERKVAYLERQLGQKQVELDLQTKLIEIASEELGLDLKKVSPPHPRLVLPPQRDDRLFAQRPLPRGWPEQASRPSSPCAARPL